MHHFTKYGLRFTCQRCSACCRYEPGFVFLSIQDMERLQHALSCTREYLLDRYCRKIHINGKYRISLIEKSNYDCIFWENGGCIVYKSRPLQCRTYPFWGNNLISKTSWDTLAESCPGINKGRLHSWEEIEEYLAMKDKEEYEILS